MVVACTQGVLTQRPRPFNGLGAAPAPALGVEGRCRSALGAMEHAFQDIQAFKGYLQAVIPPGEDSGARETTISKYWYGSRYRLHGSGHNGRS